MTKLKPIVSFDLKKYRSLSILLVLFIAVFTLLHAQTDVASGGYVQQSGSLAGAGAAQMAAGNYCVSCHLPDDARVQSVTAWRGGIEREESSPCPAAKSIHEELYFTERLLLMIDRTYLQAGSQASSIDARLAAYTQTYSRMLDAPVVSLDAFTSEAQGARFRLGKLHNTLNQMSEVQKARRVLIAAGLVTLALLVSLAWGMRNAQKYLGERRFRIKRLLSIPVVILLAAIFGFFTLPLFRDTAAEVASATVAELARQTVLDTAQRAASTADQAQARAWMLARVGAAWQERDSVQAQVALDEALLASAEAQSNEYALWGRAQAVQESSVGDMVALGQAALIANELDASRARFWAVPLIASEWALKDAQRAAEILTQEEGRAKAASGIYRDLQLRAIALAWLNLDPARAAQSTSLIADSALRAWTWREIAQKTGAAAYYEQAAQVGRRIADPVQRARVLREIGSASGKTDLFAEALAALQEASGAPLAYALSDLAAASGDASLVEKIEPAYPQARALAYYQLGQFEQAWAAAENILDPYERGRAQAAIAASWGESAKAASIGVPLYRDLALRDVTQKTGDTSLANSIQLVYYKVQALTGLSQYSAAWEAASGLGEAYPLVELALGWASQDPQAALAVVEGMTREVDKAQALREIALATGDDALFERALAMALAGRVRGDPLSPSVLSLLLGEGFFSAEADKTDLALAQAYEAALRIAIK